MIPKAMNSISIMIPDGAMMSDQSERGLQFILFLGSSGAYGSFILNRALLTLINNGTSSYGGI